MTGGFLATLGWIMFTIYDPEHVATEGNQWIVFNFLIIFGGVFIAFGLPGFYLSQAHRVGIPGLIAIIVFFIGIVIPFVAVQSIETATSPDVPPNIRIFVSIGGPSLFLGVLLTGIITYFAGIYPRWLAAVLIISVLLGLLTRLFSLPPIFDRGGIIPAVFTAIVMIIGLYMSFKLRVNRTTIP